MNNKYFNQLLCFLLVAVLSPTNSFSQKDSNLVMVDDPIVAALDSLYKLDLFDESLKQINYPSNSESKFPKDSVPRYTPEIYAERLAKLNEATPFDLRYNSSVQNFIDLYVVRRREIVERMMGLSHYYFPMFEEALSKYNLPLELKYLAICESALNPIAKSRAGAAGLWQFMYPTGKMFGLKVNSYIDERHDPLLATEAACKYFEYLHARYNNWELVLAAYNAGPGNVNRAIRRSGGKRTYWEVRPYLPRETRGYVPAFIAVNYMMNYTAEHNIYSIEPKQYFSQTDTITLKKQLSFHQISKIIAVSEEDLHFLNPCYTKKVIPILKGYTHVLTLPSEKIGVFVNNEDSIYAEAKRDSATEIIYVPQDVIRTYRVRSGDNLGSIAQRNGVTVSQLKRWNNKRSSRINIGEKLKIHVKSYVASGNKKTSSTPRTSTSGGYKYYTVRNGDNLWVIASRFKTSVSTLKKLNNIGSKHVLQPGQKIKIRKL